MVRRQGSRRPGRAHSQVRKSQAPRKHGTWVRGWTQVDDDLLLAAMKEHGEDRQRRRRGDALVRVAAALNRSIGSVRARARRLRALDRSPPPGQE